MLKGSKSCMDDVNEDFSTTCNKAHESSCIAGAAS